MNDNEPEECCPYEELQEALRTQKERIIVKELSDQCVDGLLKAEEKQCLGKKFCAWLILSLYLIVFIAVSFFEDNALYLLGAVVSGVLFYVGRSNAKSIEKSIKRVKTVDAKIRKFVPSLGVFLLLVFIYRRFAVNYFDGLEYLESSLSTVLLVPFLLAGAVCAIGLPVLSGAYSICSLLKYEMTKNENGDIVLEKKD